MTDLSKTTRPRFGSDWDVDLGWVLIWLFLFCMIAFVAYCLCNMSVANNTKNISRDEYYASHCKIVSTAYNQNSGGNVYQCQNK